MEKILDFWTKIEVTGNGGINIVVQKEWCSVETCEVINEMKRKIGESCQIVKEETHLNPDNYENNHINRETKKCDKTNGSCIVTWGWCKK